MVKYGLRIPQSPGSLCTPDNNADGSAFVVVYRVIYSFVGRLQGLCLQHRFPTSRTLICILVPLYEVSNCLKMLQFHGKTHRSRLLKFVFSFLGLLMTIERLRSCTPRPRTDCCLTWCVMVDGSSSVCRRRGFQIPRLKCSFLDTFQ